MAPDFLALELIVPNALSSNNWKVRTKMEQDKLLAGEPKLEV